MNKGRNNTISEAKSVICFIAYQHLKETTNHIAATLDISQPAVSYLKKKGKALIDEGAVSIEDTFSGV